MSDARDYAEHHSYDSDSYAYEEAVEPEAPEVRARRHAERDAHLAELHKRSDDLRLAEDLDHETEGLFRKVGREHELLRALAEELDLEAGAARRHADALFARVRGNRHGSEYAAEASYRRGAQDALSNAAGRIRAIVGANADTKRRIAREAGLVCTYCGRTLQDHGTQGWCDGAVTGQAPGATHFEVTS